MRKYILTAALAITLFSLQACSYENNTQKPAASGSVTQQPATTTPQAEQKTPVTTSKPTQTTKPATTTAPQSTAPQTTKQPEPTATTTTPPVTTAPQATVSAKGNITNGATIYKKNCAGCHGNTGEGNGPAASSLKPKPANFVAADYKDSKGKNPRDYTDAEMLDIINNGRKGTAMPAWKKQLSAEQINDSLAYVRSLAQ